VRTGLGMREMSEMSSMFAFPSGSASAWPSVQETIWLTPWHDVGISVAKSRNRKIWREAIVSSARRMYEWRPLSAAVMLL